MEAPRTVDIPLSGGDFLAATTLLSYLIYPGADSKSQRNRADAECAIGVEAIKRRGARKLSSPLVSVPWHYFDPPDEQRRRILRKVHTEYGRRMAAARIGWPLLRRVAIEFQGQKEPPLTRKALAERFKTDAGESEASNALSRAFYPTLPVLHLAVVIELSAGFSPDLRRAPKTTKEEVARKLLADAIPHTWSEDIYDFVLIPHLAELVLKGADDVAQLMALAPPLQEATSALIRFRRV